MSMNQWNDRWNQMREACRKHNATFPSYREEEVSSPRFQIGPPATPSEVAHLEQQLGFDLPTSFRRVLTEYSGAVDVAWQLPDDPEPPLQISWGEFGWNLNTLVELEDTRWSWIHGDVNLDPTFGDPDDPYDAVWHHKFVFFEVCNGDMLSIELGLPDQQPVVYLSHDGADEHGHWLGADFEDFVDRFTQLGCPGPEDFSFFTDGGRSLLLPNSENGRMWRSWFGMP